MQIMQLSKSVIPVNICHFLTHVMLRQHHTNTIENTHEPDVQVSDALITIRSNVLLDTVCEKLWPYMESVTGLELIPTYAYARLYKNGNELKFHQDRESCEVSITLQLGRSHNYAWPIYVKDGDNGKISRFDLQEGDGVIYRGDDFHWREPCDGPEGYYSGQLFCHYVKANGKYKNFAGDKRWVGEIPFVRNRTFNMEIK